MRKEGGGRREEEGGRRKEGDLQTHTAAEAVLSTHMVKHLRSESPRETIAALLSEVFLFDSITER